MLGHRFRPRLGRTPLIASLSATCLAAGCGGEGSEAAKTRGASASTPASTTGTAPQATTEPAVEPLIAYACGATDPDICVMNADGTDVRRLTEGSANESPSWSPDGTRIAFSSDRDGNYEIYVMNADGSDPRRLTTSASLDLAPRWSPDGASLAYVSDRDGNLEIYVMNADGTRQVNLTMSPADDFDPAWAPNGKGLAFARDLDGEVEVYLMDPRGEQVTRFTKSFSFTPAFSPDTSKLAFTGPSGIYVAPLAGGAIERLTYGRWDTEPAWSPDGKTIAFRRGKTGPRAEIYVVNADGTDLRRLTDNSIADGLPDWGPAPGDR